MSRIFPWLVCLVSAMCLVASVAAYFLPGDFVARSLAFGLLAVVGLFWLVCAPVINAIRQNFR